MKITKTVVIKKSAEEVWNLIAHDFDKAHLWMGPIPHSYGIQEGESKQGAPMTGRICHLSDNPDGAKVKEVITQYHEASKTLAFDVYPINNPAIVPIKQNKVQMKINATGPAEAQVIWTAQPQLKLIAYAFYPLLRMIFPIAFAKLLKGLKDYMEAPKSSKNTATV
jgi:hypothetical protein